MDAVLLDTDVFSFLLRPADTRASLYRRHVQNKTVAITFVTVGELYFWAARRKWSGMTLASLEEKLKAVVVIPYDLQICKTYATLKNALKTQSGSDRVIGANDLWIASCAVRHNLPLVTNNRKHFEGIPGLKVITETPPPKAQSSPPRTESLFQDPES